MTRYDNSGYFELTNADCSIETWHMREGGVMVIYVYEGAPNADSIVSLPLYPGPI